MNDFWGSEDLEILTEAIDACRSIPARCIFAGHKSEYIALGSGIVVRTLA